MAYRPQSPDLSALHSGYRPQSPDLSGISQTNFASSASYQTQSTPQQRQYQAAGYGNTFGISNPGTTLNVQSTSQSTNFQHLQPAPTNFGYQHNQYANQQQYGFDPSQVKQEDNAFIAATNQPQVPFYNNLGMAPKAQTQQMMNIKSEASDPTHGVVLKTSFPVARIKRIMQADEDIGKVAQVTPHVVSRALELFMIKLITAASEQARGPGGAASGKGPRRVLAQHMKRAIQADDTFDFLADIISKVPDAPSKATKKEVNNSDSEDAKQPKKRGKKRKDSTDDY